MNETIIERITPAKAKKYLKLNAGNRPIRSGHVDFLAREITSGHWKLNGATVVFNGGSLIDGQHRLFAVLRAKKSIKSLVVRGADKSSFHTIDTGKPRSAGDVLHIAGQKHANILGGSARLVWSYQNGRFFRKDRASNSTVVEFVTANPELAVSVAFIRKTKCRKFASLALCGALHYMMAKKDREVANRLFVGIGKGFLREDGEPFFTLREKLIDCSQATARTPTAVLGVYIIKAWNACRSGNRLKQFKFLESEGAPAIR